MLPRNGNEEGEKGEEEEDHDDELAMTWVEPKCILGQHAFTPAGNAPRVLRWLLGENTE